MKCLSHWLEAELDVNWPKTGGAPLDFRWNSGGFSPGGFMIFRPSSTLHMLNATHMVRTSCSIHAAWRLCFDSNHLSFWQSFLYMYYCLIPIAFFLNVWKTELLFEIEKQKRKGYWRERNCFFKAFLQVTASLVRISPKLVFRSVQNICIYLTL